MAQSSVEIRVCECGCGEEFSLYNQWGYCRRFVHGHNARMVEMQALATKGKRRTEVLEARKQQYQMLMRLPSVRKRCAESTKSFFANVPGAKARWGRMMKEVQNRPEVRRKKSVAQSLALTLEHRKHQSILVKNLWKTTDYVSAQMRARGCSPNKVETRIDQILKYRWPNDWKYVGDGQCVIGGKVPDFININGKKAVIEVFGRYWHKKTDAATRTKHFKRYGFKTLCVWEDISDSQFIKRVEEKFYGLTKHLTFTEVSA